MVFTGSTGPISHLPECSHYPRCSSCQRGQKPRQRKPDHLTMVTQMSGPGRNFISFNSPLLLPHLSRIQMLDTRLKPSPRTVSQAPFSKAGRSSRDGWASVRRLHTARQWSLIVNSSELSTSV